MKAKTLAKAAGAKHKVGTSNRQIKKPEEEGGRKRHMWRDKGFLRAPVYTRASRKLHVCPVLDACSEKGLRKTSIVHLWLTIRFCRAGSER